MHIRSLHLQIIILSSLFLQVSVYFTSYLSDLQVSWDQRFLHWDSLWYTHLARNGYEAIPDFADDQAKQFAFYPLWPMILRSLGAIGLSLPVHVVGAVFSWVIFVICLTVFFYLTTRKQETQNFFLAPKSLLALCVFAFNPASYSFFTNHTESLFLVLSIASLYFAHDRKLVIASVLAGLAALTRNQGVILAITVGLFFLFDENERLWDRFRRFLASGAISGVIHSLWHLYGFFIRGDIFATLSAQDHFTSHAIRNNYISNMFWLSPNNGFRALIFWSVLASTFYLLIKYKFRGPYLAIGFYLSASALLWPIQGNNFPTVFRYSTVLFPYWFFLGDRLDVLLKSDQRWKQACGCLVLVCLALGCINLSWRYFQNLWPY